MKKFLMALTYIVLIVLVVWHYFNPTTKYLDELISGEIEACQEGLVEHDVFKDLYSKKYFNNDTFLLAEYAKDLGYKKITFPKTRTTALILRRGIRKIIVKTDGTIYFFIYNDPFEDGIDINIFEDEGKYKIDCGGLVLEGKTNGKRLFQIVNAFNHLRDSNTLLEMAEKNRHDSEILAEDPVLSKSLQ